MRPELEDEYHQMLANVINHVLRCRTGPIRVPELAEFAGFSRFHLVRLFRSVTEETLEQFLRRIRLERAGFCLKQESSSVLEIATDSGYESPEAFARSFKKAHGLSPSEFRSDASSRWQLYSPSDLHWNPHYGLEEIENFAGFVCSSTTYRPAQEAIVWRLVGPYRFLSRGWMSLESQYGAAIPKSSRFITLYIDNMWTHPTSSTLRADIGWISRPGEIPPPGMRKIILPAGLYAYTTEFIERHERNDAWSYMGGRYGAKTECSYDEYKAWPLPFEEVQTRIWRRVPDRSGGPDL